jgi:hypothetical protein
MPKKSKPKKIKTNDRDTSLAVTKRGELNMKGKELKIDKELDKKKEIKEKDVFDFSYKK